MDGGRWDVGAENKPCSVNNLLGAGGSVWVGGFCMRGRTCMG